MPKALRDNLHLCISKLKGSALKPTPCPLPAAPTSPSDVFRNYNSIYDPTYETSTSTSKSSSSTLSPESDDPQPDLSSLHASTRFFFSSPGNSNSIVDSPPPEAPAATTTLAVSKMSTDPYRDFRSSMEEMVEANGLDVRKDWEILHELLLCYLALNRKHTHKYIVRAFADLLLSMPKVIDPLSDSDASGRAAG